MSGYAKSAEVHRVMRSIFSPWLKLSGFRQVGSGKCAYFKPSAVVPTELLAFEVQCNSFASSQIGGKFTLNAAVGPIDARHLSGRHSRILMYSSADLLVSASSMQAQIVSRHPKNLITTGTWRRDNDNWCSYYDLDDLRAWAELLLPQLPALLLALLEKFGHDPEQYGLLPPHS